MPVYRWDWYKLSINIITQKFSITDLWNPNFQARFLNLKWLLSTLKVHLRIESYTAYSHKTKTKPLYFKSHRQKPPKANYDILYLNINKVSMQTVCMAGS